MNGLPALRQHDAVVLFDARSDLPEHEALIQRDIALRLADMMGIPFDGTFDNARHAGTRCYVVPSCTIMAPALKNALSIASDMDLFGGYTPHTFIATKAITHGLVSPNAMRPEGWSNTFSKHVDAVTLPGFTVFSHDDARQAAENLLRLNGAIRIKPVHAKAGRGQLVVSNASQLTEALAQHDEATLKSCGLVLETHLNDVTTYSVGQVRLPGLTVSYVGTQRLTQDNSGEAVYGGSRLHCTRGGFAALHDLPLDDICRRAAALAAHYDAAADECFPEFFASRRNYDVAAGVDTEGVQRMGVLEQSWRIGGASRAEIAALEVFSADPQCQSLWAETLEVFGPDAVIPAHAIETYAGEDPDLGLIRKYVLVEAYGNQQ